MNTAKSKCAMGSLWPRFRLISAGQASFGLRLSLWLMLLLVVSVGRTSAQTSSEQTPTGQLSNNPLRLERGHATPSLDGDTEDPAIQQRRLHLLSVSLHKSIVSDTDKLLKLVTELNAEISSTNPTSLTREQIRKIAAIEKLARNVKDQMRTPVQAAPAFVDAAQPLENYPNRR